MAPSMIDLMDESITGLNRRTFCLSTGNHKISLDAL